MASSIRTTEPHGRPGAGGRARPLVAVLGLVLVAALLAPGGASAAPAPPPIKLTANQTAIKNLINAERKKRKLPLLVSYASAQTKAQAWAEKMAREQKTSHSNLWAGLTGCLTGVGENVGWASTTRGVHDAFMKSAYHRNNILSITTIEGGKRRDRRWTGVGVGYAIGKNKMVYIAEVFVRRC